MSINKLLRIAMLFIFFTPVCAQDDFNSTLPADVVNKMNEYSDAHQTYLMNKDQSIIQDNSNEDGFKRLKLFLDMNDRLEGTILDYRNREDLGDRHGNGGHPALSLAYEIKKNIHLFASFHELLSPVKHFYNLEAFRFRMHLDERDFSCSIPSKEAINCDLLVELSFKERVRYIIYNIHETYRYKSKRSEKMISLILEMYFTNIQENSHPEDNSEIKFHLLENLAGSVVFRALAYHLLMVLSDEVTFPRYLSMNILNLKERLEFIVIKCSNKISKLMAMNYPHRLPQEIHLNCKEFNLLALREKRLLILHELLPLVFVDDKDYMYSLKLMKIYEGN